jgi:hypothetical protein
MPENSVHKSQDPALEEAVRELTHVHVPLQLYIGNQRKIVGEAVVTESGIEAYIDSASYRETAEILYEMITDGVIQGVSVSFNAPPAIPMYENGTIRWMKPSEKENEYGNNQE